MACAQQLSDLALRAVAKGAWDESLHPRDAQGRFGTTSGGKEIVAGQAAAKYKNFSKQDHLSAEDHYLQAARVRTMAGASPRNAYRLAKEHHDLAGSPVNTRGTNNPASGPAKPKADPQVSELARLGNQWRPKPNEVDVEEAHEQSSHAETEGTAEAHLRAASAHGFAMNNTRIVGLKNSDIYAEHKELGLAHLARAKEILTEDSADASKPYGRKLAKDERDALTSYTNPAVLPVSFKSINDHLAGLDGDANAETKKTAATLSSAVQNSRLPQDKTFYRGTILPKSASVGTILQPRGFTSVSDTKSVGEHFAEKASSSGKGNTSALLTIRGKAGDSVLPVVESFGASTVAGRVADDEREHIYHHATAFKVVKDDGVHPEHGYRMLTVEPIHARRRK